MEAGSSKLGARPAACTTAVRGLLALVVSFAEARLRATFRLLLEIWRSLSTADSRTATIAEESQSRTTTMAEDWQSKVSCPLTWTDNGVPLEAMPLPMAKSIEAEGLEFAPTPWHRLLESIGLAYAFRKQSRADASERVIKCYAIIVPGHDYDCPLIRDYRPAIRHILDGFWAMLEWQRQQKTSPLLEEFVSSITPFDQLPPGLQAAVHAVRASVTKIQRDVALTHAQLAVQKSPGEGEWHHLLSLCTGLPGSGATPGETLAHLRQAHRLRPGPHTAVSLARMLATKEKWRAKELVDAVLLQHPDAPYVLSLAGEILILIDGLNVDTAAQAKRLLAHCSSLIGERSSTELKLASLCWRQGGREAEARAHYQKACSLSPTGTMPAPAYAYMLHSAPHHVPHRVPQPHHVPPHHVPQHVPHHVPQHVPQHAPLAACMCCSNRAKPANKVKAPSKPRRISRRK